MALLHAIQNSLLGDEELHDKYERGGFPKGPSPFAETLPPRKRLMEKEIAIPFTPIGIGKPLTIEIQKIYRGNDSGGLGFGKPDLLLVSATKPLSQVSKAPRAINLLDEDFDPAQRFHSIHAVSKGASLVYHTPSLTESRQVLTLEMTIDRFPKEGIQTVTDAIRQAAGLPVFASASAYMLAGSGFLKLAASITEAIIDGQPFFRGSHEIRFGVPPYTNNESGQIVLVRDGDEHQFGSCEITPDGTVLYSATKTPYVGDTPYVSLVLDGREVPEYEAFEPTLASVDLLDQFFGKSGNTSQSTKELLKAVSLYSDIQNRKKADAQRAKLKKLETDSPEHQKAQELMEAYLKNIREPLLQ